MGVSTDAQICYGIKFDEEFEFPWSGDEYNDDIEGWWFRSVLGFHHSFEIFDAAGEWIGGVEPSAERIEQYEKEWRGFKETASALPVKLVRHCSYEYPMYILAVPSSCLTASRGYPESFDLGSLAVTDAERDTLLEFCLTWLDCDDEPRWWLSSFWG